MISGWKRSLIFWVLVTFAALISIPSSWAASTQSQVVALPTVFETNKGQAPGEYRFLSRHGSVDAYFSENGIDLMIPSKSGKHSRVRLSLTGSRAGVAPEGDRPLPGVSNYLLGNDPSRWIKGVPTQSQVVYRQVYPGVDLVFHGDGVNVEHDFHIAAGADPEAIRFAIQGADHVDLDSMGNIQIKVGDRTLLFQKPRTYQENDNGRQSIDSSFVLNADGSVQFRVGAYDRTRKLVIDPVFVFSTYLASSRGDTPRAITSDSAGNVYVTGYTDGSDFPLQDAMQKTGTGSPNAFVSKLDPTGHTLLYSTYLGGSSRNYGHSIAIDSQGNVIVGGLSASNDFPHVGSLPALTCQGNNTCYFLASLKPDGSAFNYAGLIGGISPNVLGSQTEVGNAIIALDASRNVYLAGVTDDPHFVITAGTLATHVQGGGYPFNSTFIMKVNSSGTIVYSTIVPGVAVQDPTINLNNVFVPVGISVNSYGQATIAGTAGPGLPSTTGVVQKTFPNASSGNASAGFVLKISGTASSINYATYIPGTDTVGGYAPDKAGSSYVTGGTSETNLPVSSNAYQKTMRSGQNCTCNSGFVLKLNSTGTAVLAATYLEGTPTIGNSGTSFSGLALDSSGNVFVGGFSASTDFPLVNPFTSIWETNTTIGDMVLAEVSPDLSSLLFGTFLSATDQFYSGSNFFALSVDATNHLLVTGQTLSSAFPTTPGSFQPTPPSGSPYTSYPHAFVTRLDMATPAPSVCPDTWNVDFGSVLVKSSSTKIVNLTNCGNRMLSVSSLVSSSPAVTIQQSCASSVLAGKSCPVSLTYSPIDASPLSGTLTLTDNAEISPLTIQLTGGGVAPQLSPSTGSFDLGHVLVHTTGGGMWLWFSNSGNANLTISLTSTIGDFSISQNSCISVLPPSEGCYLKVAFSPTAAGIRTGTLLINSDDPVHPHASLSLVGTGDATYAVPLISSLSKQAAQIGNGPISFQVWGTNFYPASIVKANGVAQTTTYLDGGHLQVTLSAAIAASSNELSITVFNPTPGGGSSVALPFTLYQALAVNGRNLTSVPGSSLIYASIPASDPTHPNTVIPINPATGALGTPIPVGNNPKLLTPSSDGKYLFVANDGDQTVQRINLATGLVEKTYAFPPTGTTCCGTSAADELKGVPGSPKQVVLAASIPSYGYGKMALYDDSGMVNYVPTDVALYNSSFAFAGSPAAIYGLPFLNSTTTPFFSVVTIDVQGLHFSPPTGGGNYNNSTGATVASDGTLLYTSAGQVWNPTTEKQTGTFPVTTFNATSYPNLRNFIFEASTSHLFLLGDQETSPGTSSLVLSAYDPASLKLSNALQLPDIQDALTNNLVRWGTNGFAFLSESLTDPTAEVVYVFKSSVAAKSPTSNPVPQISLLVPTSATTGGTGLYLTINGNGFVESSVVDWQGSPLATSFVSSTALTALVPASDLTTSGTVAVTVNNPSPGGGSSNAVSFNVSPLAPLLSFSSSALNFANQTLGTASAAKTVAVQNPGTAPLTISAIAVAGAQAGSFQQTNNCGVSLAAGGNCIVSIVFKPTNLGVNNAVLQFTDDASGSPHSLSLTGSASGVQMTSPNGGESWVAGTTHAITWKYDGVSGNIKLVLYKAGVVSQAITLNTPIGSGGTGSYNWTVPTNLTPGNDYTIRVSTLSAPIVLDYSDATFSIAPFIQLAYPNGGESWAAGSRHTITWKYDGLTSNVKLVLYKAGAVSQAITLSTPIGSGGTGSFNWTVPTTLPPGTDYSIRVSTLSAPILVDYSDASFSIAPGIQMTSPNGGESWAAGSTHTITWKYDGLTSNVKLVLYKAGVVSQAITLNTPIGSGGTASYNWTLPTTLPSGSDYTIRVSTLSAPIVLDYSDATFSIGP